MKALVFDFDGLIVDTETMSHTVWVEIYRELRLEFPNEKWLATIGTDGSSFDPYQDVLDRAAPRVTLEGLREKRRMMEAKAVASLRPLPGVKNYLENAREQQLGIAVASSSSLSWVQGNLERLGLAKFFDALVCEDHVERVKPHPDLYLEALSALKVDPGDAIALEDSPNGIAAAKSAGLFCVAVPNPLTRDLPLGNADLKLESLAALSLSELLQRARSHSSRR